MDNINDGGPAFPIDPEHGVSHKGEIYRATMGMTLRDWFAGQALAGLLAGTLPPAIPMMADDAYKQADAMLAARESKP